MRETTKGKLKMKIDWMETGKHHADTDDKRDALKAAADGLKWIDTTGGGKTTLPFCQGQGIGEVIRQLNIPRVCAVGYTHEMAPFGLYGIRAKYKQGFVDLFVMDEGSEIKPVFAVCHWEEKKEVAA